MSSTRSIIAPPPFAASALTVIPPTPIAGVSYRDPVAGPASSADGWPYAERVNSAEFNQLVFQWSSLLSIMDLKGLLGWSDLKDYTEDAIAFGSDGKVYKWLQESGPGTGAGVRDPISEPSYWREFGEDSGGIVGQITSVASLTSPAKHLKCNGAAYSRATYPELFQKLVTDAGFTSQAFTVNIASPAVFNHTAHGFTGGERLRLSTTGALPTGLSTATDYFVDPLDANNFRLMTAVVGGTRITTTGTQSGTHSYLQSWFGLGDGSTTFNVPDERANVLRGLDEGRGQDTGRSMGTQQRGTIIAGDLQASGAGFSSNSPFAHSQIIANQYGQDLGTDADWSAFGSTVVLSGSFTPVVPVSSAYLLGRNRMQNGAYPFYIRYEA